MIVLVFTCTYLFLTSSLSPIENLRLFFIFFNDCGEWLCHLVLWEIRGRSTGANGPQQAPARRERQAICCRLSAYRNALSHFTGAPLTAFLESAHWNMLKANAVLPRAVVEESSMAMLCLWTLWSCWSKAIYESGFSFFFFLYSLQYFGIIFYYKAQIYFCYPGMNKIPTL